MAGLFGKLGLFVYRASLDQMVYTVSLSAEVDSSCGWILQEFIEAVRVF